MMQLSNRNVIKLAGDDMKYAMILLSSLAAFQVSAATAQITTMTYPSQTSAFGVEPIIRVATTFRVAVAVNDGQSVSNMAAQETARREIYAIAAKECEVLAEAFKAECRLGSLSTFAPAPAPNSPPSSTPVALGSINATANYELKPRATGPAR